jgi:hypothetical protein
MTEWKTSQKIHKSAKGELVVYECSSTRWGWTAAIEPQRIQCSGSAKSELKAMDNAEAALEVLEQFAKLEVWDLNKPPPGPDPDINMVYAHHGCLLCGSGDSVCYHPAAEVRMAFRLLANVPRARDDR